MGGEGFFFQAFVYLTAAVLSVPVAKRLGLGSVLGYLIAGIIIGPFVLGLIGEEGQDVMHFAEFGVVMMLFLVGLELQPSLLWRMRTPILGLGGLQVGVTSVLIAAVAMLFGLSWQESAAIGMVLALSSTAIVLQTLNEKNLMKTGGGQSAFATLLFQDIAVIPMLALFPLLAIHQIVQGDGHHGTSWVEGMPGWMHALVVLGAVATIIVGGHFAIRPAFRFLARTKLREVFVAAGLLLVIGIALLMEQVGLSPALGTFLAGVVLANSEYRHELESDIEPFKGLLLGLFFIAVGASIDFQLIAQSPMLIAGLVVALMALKFAVLLVLGRVFKMGIDQNLLYAFSLAQGGEFAFVLFSFANQAGVLTTQTTAPMIAVVAVTMALTPLFMLVFEKVVQPRVGTKPGTAKEFDAVHGDTPVIIAGYGRFGQIVARMLDTQHIASTVLEYDSDQVELLRKFGRKVFYGDASRHDLLHSAGAEKAQVLILAIDNPEKIMEMVHTARKHFPHLKILARAYARSDAFELVNAQVDHVYRETFESAVRMGADALRELGVRSYQAERAAQRFRRHDEELLHEFAAIQGEKEYVNMVKKRLTEVEALLREDMHEARHQSETGWDVEALRTDAAE